MLRKTEGLNKEALVIILGLKDFINIHIAASL